MRKENEGDDILAFEDLDPESRNAKIGKLNENDDLQDMQYTGSGFYPKASRNNKSNNAKTEKRGDN